MNPNAKSSCLIFSVLINFAYNQICSQEQQLPSKDTVYRYTGTDQTFTVPPGVTNITVKAWGGGGAGGNYLTNREPGGGGGFATDTFSVIPGQTITVIVGGGGHPGAGPGAYGGGGAKDCGKGGRGGGRSAIIVRGGEQLTAGAGGGGGGGTIEGGNQARGGGGGGKSGQTSPWSNSGDPGTQDAGGAGGLSTANNNCQCGSNAGSYHQGGTAGCYDNGYNGSGGGGYYGGGSGTDLGDGGGGGGSSRVRETGLTIGASDDIPGNIADPDYGDQAGYGGPKGQAGKPGRIVIRYSICAGTGKTYRIWASAFIPYREVPGFIIVPVSCGKDLFDFGTVWLNGDNRDYAKSGSARLWHEVTIDTDPNHAEVVVPGSNHARASNTTGRIESQNCPVQKIVTISPPQPPKAKVTRNGCKVTVEITGSAETQFLSAAPRFLVPTITYSFKLIFDEETKTLSWEGQCRKWIFPSYELYVEGIGWLFKEDAAGFDVFHSRLNPFFDSNISRSGTKSLK